MECVDGGKVVRGYIRVVCGCRSSPFSLSPRLKIEKWVTEL